MLTVSTLLGVLITEGVAFVGSLIYFGYRAGRLLETIEGHERRILRLENKIFYEGGLDESDS